MIKRGNEMVSHHPRWGLQLMGWWCAVNYTWFNWKDSFRWFQGPLLHVAPLWAASVQQKTQSRDSGGSSPAFRRTVMNIHTFMSSTKFLIISLSSLICRLCSYLLGPFHPNWEGKLSAAMEIEFSICMKMNDQFPCIVSLISRSTYTSYVTASVWCWFNTSMESEVLFSVKMCFNCTTPYIRSATG